MCAQGCPCPPVWLQKLDGVPNEHTIPEPIARQLQPYVTSIQREGLSCRDPSLLHFPPILGIRSFFLELVLHGVEAVAALP